MSSAWCLKGIRLRVLPKDQYVYQITLKVYVTTKLILGTFLVVNFFHFTVIEATGLLGTLRFKSCFVPLTLIYSMPQVLLHISTESSQLTPWLCLSILN